METDQLRAIRRFNRLITQRLGALGESYLQRGRPLGQARLIYEIGSQGCEVRALRASLGLDSGYLSRLLRALEAEGLVRVRGDSGDGRVRRATLTVEGMAELVAYDRASDGLAHAILAPLGPNQRRRLAAAMSEVERLIRAGTLEIGIEAPGSQAARWCLEAYFQELATRFETGFDPAKSIPAGDGELTPPSGLFLLARLDGKPAGCGALKVKGAGIGEIKRMWTEPSARGLGVAARILAALEAEAAEIGLKTLRLETNQTLFEARALYRGRGYQEVAPFNDEPYAHFWFEKPL
jgi:DNA-binding MarR family transcriptional regulator/GNAT superfamily N-acetyltransferase